MAKQKYRSTHIAIEQPKRKETGAATIAISAVTIPLALTFLSVLITMIVR